MVLAMETIEENFPLHKLIWEDRPVDLDALISSESFSVSPQELEKLDPRDRTPLALAVALGHVDCAAVLLRRNANAQFEHSSGWTVLQEAICRGDPDLLKLILENRDAQKNSRRSNLVPDLLRRLADAPDFYVEIKFEFKSWMPFIGAMIPGNVHRVYKMGSMLRVDSVILQPDEPVDWSRSITLIFQGREKSVQTMEIDHSTRKVYKSVMLSGDNSSNVKTSSRAYEKTVSHRLSNPVVISYVDLDKIAFERNKTGLWGWGRSDKSEKVNNYDCKVFSATNVEFVTKIRSEHLSEEDKHKIESKSHVHKLLHTFGTVETSESTEGATASNHVTLSSLRGEITAGEYFDKDLDLCGRDIGRSKEIRTKVNKFKAQVWLCEDYPLNLQEQIMPIIDIMALSSPMFSKLKNFIQMQIPAGFPVKIEIPVFHVISGCITFHNIFGTEDPINGVEYFAEDGGKLNCILSELLFDPPAHYKIKSTIRPTPLQSSDDDLFGWTLSEDEDLGGKDGKMVDIYEALNAPRTLVKDSTPDSDTEEQLLQRAIEESLMMARMKGIPGWTPNGAEGFSGSSRGQVGFNIPLSQDDSDGSAAAGAAALGRTASFDELQAALDLSRRQIEEEERLRIEEEEALKRVLELSLLEK